MGSNNIDGVNLTRAQLVQQLTEKGIAKETLAKCDDAQLLQFAKENGINAGLEVEKTEPKPEDELRREGEKYRRKLDEDFVAKAKTYSEAMSDFEALKKEEEQVRLEYNQAVKKTISGTKAEKDAKRAELAEQLKTVREALAQARQRADEAKKALGTDLAAANRFNRELAEKDEANLEGRQKTDTQRAAKTEVNDFFDSDEGKKASLDATKQVARGDADHKLNKAERTARQEEVARDISVRTDENGNETEAVSNRYARNTQVRSEKNYQQLLKEQALQKIIIGDKDAYEAQKKDDANGKPTVTFMDEKTYKAAKEYCASKGLVLPEYQKGMVLEGDLMREYQQLMEDAVGAFGSRADLNERKDISDNYRDISFKQARRMIEAANIDVQKDYKWAGIAAGAAVTAATAGIGGLWSITEAVAAEIIPGPEIEIFIPGIGGIGDTGHYEIQKLDDIIVKEGVPASSKFRWGKAIGAAAAGPIVATLVTALANYDQNLLKKNKNLADVVYNSLDVPAFKDWADNDKKVVAKFVANPNLTAEQKLAILEKAGGLEGFKENRRELVAAMAQANAFKPGDEAPTVEEKVSLEDGGIIWDINQGDLDNDDRLKGATLVKDGKVTDAKVEENQADGLAHDQKVVSIDKDNTAKAFEQAQLRDSNGRLINQNRVEARSQYVIADEKGETKVELGKGTPEAPDKIQFTDNTNGADHHNKYDYRKLSPEEAKAKVKNFDENKVYYELVEARDPNGKDITKTRGKVFELEFSTTDRQAYRNVVDDEGYTIKREKYTVRTPHYEMKAADNFGKSSPHYLRTGARPKGVKEAPAKPAASAKPAAPAAKAPATEAATTPVAPPPVRDELKGSPDYQKQKAQAEAKAAAKPAVAKTGKAIAGEHFRDTAKRLGVNVNDPEEYKAFCELNPQAAKRSHGGWFRLDEEVKLPPKKA